MSEAPDGFVRAAEAARRKPFSIGLAPFAIDDWFEIDARLGDDLALKDEILTHEGRDAFDALEGSLAAQTEALERIAEYLLRRHPKIYARVGEAIRVAPSGRRVLLVGEAPLLTASRLVQEDLLLIRRFADGWRLEAGSLSFPSTWRLQDKLGRPMAAIHAPVPDFAGATQARVDRIFDNLNADAPLERFNLSIYGDARLRHAEARPAPGEKFSEGEPILSRAHLRIERQTLSKMPQSGAILFTIRIHLDSLANLAECADGPQLAVAIASHVAAMTPEQLAYKGLANTRERLMAALAELANRASTPI